jgi:hypothetical protein
LDIGHCIFIFERSCFRDKNFRLKIAGKKSSRLSRVPQIVLILSTLLSCWLGMQAIHELGHVLAALASEGSVKQVVLHPLAISRTDLEANPHPLFVVWGGPMLGTLVPLAIWALFAFLKSAATFVARFFAGFCLIANGLYIGTGSFNRIGDCREMLLHGSSLWQLWLFGAVTVPLGFALWNGQAESFGLGKAAGRVNPRVAWGMLVVATMQLIAALVIGGK